MNFVKNEILKCDLLDKLRIHAPVWTSERGNLNLSTKNLTLTGDLFCKVSGCVRWVYVEKGPKCYIKAYDGKPRNLTYPLTPEDEKEFAEEVTEAPEGSGDNSTESSDQSGSVPAPAPAPGPAPAPAPSGNERRKRQASEADPDQPMETKEDRIKKRIEELKVTFTGTSDCMPPVEGKVCFINY